MITERSEEKNGVERREWIEVGKKNNVGKRMQMKRELKL